jgi:acyl-coenzyme A thioesterase PaaI-like protein
VGTESDKRDARAEPDDDAAHLNDSSEYQGCFACGARNTAGLQLIFRREGDEIVTEYTPEPQFQGFPGVVHGGVIATLLDETLNRTAVMQKRWLMTARLEIRYRQAAPMGRTLRVTARTLVSRSRVVQAEGEVRLADEPETILADAQGTFLPISAEYRAHMLAEHPELRSFFEW